MKYTSWLTLNVEMPVYNLDFTPYSDWTKKQTPVWWTANNKVKHYRHTDFHRASVENMLNAVAALFIANVYLYAELKLLDEIPLGARVCYSQSLTKAVAPTALGNIPIYKIV